MLLKKITITNYRQFQNAVINFDEDLTILAGANNSGKTSIIELFKRVFQDKKFSIDDISVDYYTHVKNNFIDSVEKLYKACKTETEFRENLKQFFSDVKNLKPVAIKIQIEVQYNKSESISMFSDYLMELDDNCTSFYFSFNYEISTTELIKSLSIEAPKIYNKKQEETTLKNKRKTKEILAKLEELRFEYKDSLLQIFNNSFKNEVYFTNKDYENEVQIGSRDFENLFKYNYLKATRLLNDEKTDNYFSISKELLNHFKQSEDWPEFKVQIVKDIKEGLKERKLNEKVKEHSLVKAQKALANIEKYFDYNRGEFSLQTDISDDLLLEFLSSSLQTFFEFNNGTKLKEFSQGLGISNLIYMCLKVEAFVKQYRPDVVNIFVIEEPEAHMHPQMERMLIKFIKEILTSDENNRVQGIITTHSNEIVKCSDIKNIRVLRINSLLSSSIYDMEIFKQSLDTDEERHFFAFLFSINYSDLIFANKIIMYEGDTEKLYIEKLLTEQQYETLSNQYISFVQFGGAYTHWYRKLVHFLGIKTLIITDIDYNKNLVSIEKIKNDTNITNAGIIQYYKDSLTLDIINSSIIPYCEGKCRGGSPDCFYKKAEIEQVTLIQSDLRKKPCRKRPKPSYAILRKKATVSDLDFWINNSNHKLIKVVSQSSKDSYSRTLEEAMLCKLLGISVETVNDSFWWSKQITDYKLKLDVPNKKSITVREVIKANKGNKTDFMYSVILSELHLKMLPNYIKEGGLLSRKRTT